MIIQKINHAPNFSAKTEYVNEHEKRKDEPNLSTKVREILGKEPDLEDGQVYRITRDGFYRLEEDQEVSLDELKLAIHDNDGKPLSDPATIYHKRVHFDNPKQHYGQIRDILELDSNIKRVAQELRENIVAKAKAAFEALKAQADALEYDLVKKAR